ncbi:MAG: TIGR03663 family protein [Anaerolineae bacterium]|nr:TIGR03663 family protein [Anaerolineae bacterium]
MNAELSEKPSFLDRPLSTLFKFNIETLLIAVLIILAIVTRFYNVDLRVMSHDEVNHVVPSYDLYEGRGYRHDPVTHGPLQFHLVALSYFLLGDSDFSSRVPAALFSIATIAFVAIAYRRYLGRIGALLAGLFFTISPYMLFYGRYTRNEAFCALFGVMMIYAVLRYLDKGDKKALYLLVISTVLNFTAKEVAYIYAAQLLLFIAIVFIERISRKPWGEAESKKQLFLILMGLAILLLVLALGFSTLHANANKPPDDGSAFVASPETEWMVIGMYIALGAGAISGLLSAIILIPALGWKAIREERSFDILMLTGTLILPLLAAFPAKLVGFNPLDYSNEGLLKTGIFLIICTAAAVALGLWWQRKLWVVCAVVFYTIFTVFYTTFFTNGQGFFTGLVGSLGYWLSQQGVQRGGQPIYYYALIQIPMYEFLAALGTILAFVLGIVYRKFSAVPGDFVSRSNLPEPQPYAEDSVEGEEKTETLLQQSVQSVPTLALLIFWSVTALAAYSVAGEKMPWLTVHIALPLLLAAGWGIGFVMEKIPWQRIANIRGISALLLLAVFVSSFAVLIYSLLTPEAIPFQGNTLEQLKATNGFILSAIAFLGSFFGVLYLLSNWYPKEIIGLMSVAVFAGLTVLTARAAVMANYINYDTAKEYLVYAHAARGPKDVLEQVEEISKRTTMGKDIVVAHDNDTLYPYWWYFRDYPNKKFFSDKPTRDLRDASIILVGDQNYTKMAPIVKNDYYEFEYMRLWWPNQDYYGLTLETEEGRQRILGALTNPEMRAAIFDIWLNRNYDLYAKATNSTALKLETWQPGSRMKMYIRKDLVAKIWNYGSLPVAQEQTTQEDPYLANTVKLNADVVIGTTGSGAGQMQAPRGIAVAPDGTIYVADSRNNRIQRLNEKGEVLATWGAMADISKGEAPGGTFNEPWGITVGPDGSVFVTDTWNHRIEKFTADGQFIKMWGIFGQGETPDAFWGPRGIAVDAQGHVYVADTGNKRIVEFTSDGDFVTQFGSFGVETGQFDEPVGVAVDAQGRVYVTDTWNQRVQVFDRGPDGVNFEPVSQWSVNGWFGESLDNKPFITVDSSGNVFISDPEGYRILEFNSEGVFQRAWGDYSPDIDGFGLTSGVAVDTNGRVWVSDAGNNRVMRFVMP